MNGSGSLRYRQSENGLPMGKAGPAGMCRNTSNRQSGRPASSTRTRVPGSSVRRLARTQPAEPPPTMTTSNRSSGMRRDATSEAARKPRRASVGSGVVRDNLHGKPVPARPGRIGGELVRQLAGAAVREVEPNGRAECARGPELAPQALDVVPDGRIGGVAEVLDPMPDHAPR